MGVQVCNDIRDAGRLPVDFDYYVREVETCIGDVASYSEYTLEQEF